MAALEETTDFSARLDEAMRLAGFKSQQALSRASGLSQPTINRLLKATGPHGPETETVRKLAHACKVSFDWLMHGQPSGSEVVRHLSNREAEWLHLLDFLGSDDIAEFSAIIRARQERNKRLIAELTSQTYDEKAS